jgi:enoyl reductase-like protein
VNILNSRTTYQFNKHFLARFIAQYDSSARRVLTDWLASYELVAGTVFHAGYGGLYEQADEPINTNGKYLMMNRGLFLKASYLHRF